MKRVLTLLVSLMLVFSLSSCSDNKNSVGSQDAESKQNVIESQDDGTIQDATDVQNNSEDETGDGSKVYSYFEALINVNLYSINDNDDQRVSLMIADDSDMTADIDSSITVQGDKITLPSSYADLVDLGWNCSEEMKNKEIEGMKKSSNSTIGSANGYNTEFNNTQGKIITVQMVNETEETKKLSECTCAGIVIDFNNSTLDFSTNGITKDTSLKDAVALLGNPRSLEYRSYSGVITAEFSCGKGSDYRRIVLTYPCEIGEAGAMKTLLISC